MSRKLLTAALILVAVSSTTFLTSCSGGPQKKRIIVLTNGSSPFWDACRLGLKQAEKDLGLDEAGYSATMEVNDGTPNGQINKLREYQTQDDIVAVAISPVDADNAAVAAEMKKLKEKGVKVICVDSDVNREKYSDSRDYYIGTDNIQGGNALGIAGRAILKDRDAQKGSFVHFVGKTGSFNARGRMDGFNQKIGEEYTQADRMGDNLDRNKAKDNVRNAITNHEDLVALVGIWSYNAPKIVDVLKEKEMVGKYAVLCFDAEPDAIAHMDKGEIDVMVVQDPYAMGYESVSVLMAMDKGDEEALKKTFTDEKQPKILTTGLKVVAPNEGSPLKADMFDEKSVTFMKLDEFKAWLKNYNLKGS